MQHANTYDDTYALQREYKNIRAYIYIYIYVYTYILVDIVQVHWLCAETMVKIHVTPMCTIVLYTHACTIVCVCARISRVKQNMSTSLWSESRQDQCFTCGAHLYTYMDIHMYVYFMYIYAYRRVYTMMYFRFDEIHAALTVWDSSKPIWNVP